MLHKFFRFLSFIIQWRITWEMVNRRQALINTIQWHFICSFYSCIISLLHAISKSAGKKQCSAQGAYFINSLFPLLQTPPFSVVQIVRRPPHRDFPLHQVTTKEEKKHIIHMYNIPPSTHAHTRLLRYTMVTTSTAGNTHRRTHTAYYLYEVLYTSDHQHRVSVFSNPHSGWKEHSVHGRDYTVRIKGVLIWVIVRGLDNKKYKEENFCFNNILLNVLQPAITVFNSAHSVFIRL